MNKLKLQPIPRVRRIPPADFQALYMESLRPVIVTDMASSCPALEKWTPQYFAENYGELRVKVYNASFAAPGKSYMSSVNEMRFKEYLSLMLTSTMDLRMFAFNIFWHAPELKKDIHFAPLANGLSKRLLFMFFGCKDSATPMHYDPDLAHLFHTVMYGRRRVVLFHNEQSRNLYRNPFTTRSYIDVDNPDFDKFPRLKDATGYQEILEPGETVFIPSGYWHYMVYEEGGYSICTRRRHASFARRLRGYRNLFVDFPIDKSMNRLFPKFWFEWKTKRARAGAL
jgi:Cupin-like domain